MEKTILFGGMLWFGTFIASFAQPTGKGIHDISTSGANSPIVIAKNFSAVYGVRADAILAILHLYEKDEPDTQKHNARVERLIKQYSQAPEKKTGATSLSDASKAQLGLSSNLAIMEALEWDLFATKNYLRTAGNNSPGVIAQGDVNIWYGIPPAALRTLAEVLENNKISMADLDGQLQAQVKKYKELKAQMATYGSDDPIVKKAELLLDAGKLYEVEQFLDNYLELQDKRLAYRHRFKGGLFQNDTTAIHYRKATVLDPNNFEYLLLNGEVEFNLGHYPEAIIYYQKALENAEAADSLSFSVTCLKNIGHCYKTWGNYTEGLNALERGIARAEALDKQSGKAPCAAVIRHMRYHKIGCLFGLRRKDEAEALVIKVREEAVAAKDHQILEDLKKESWIKD